MKNKTKKKNKSLMKIDIVIGNEKNKMLIVNRFEDGDIQISENGVELFTLNYYGALQLKNALDCVNHLYNE